MFFILSASKAHFCILKGKRSRRIKSAWSKWESRRSTRKCYASYRGGWVRHRVQARRRGGLPTRAWAWAGVGNSWTTGHWQVREDPDTVLGQVAGATSCFWLAQDLWFSNSVVVRHSINSISAFLQLGQGYELSFSQEILEEVPNLAQNHGHLLKTLEVCVCRIFQARILEWAAISYSRRSSWPRDRTCISCIGRQILYHWATWEASFTDQLWNKYSIYIMFWL